MHTLNIMTHKNFFLIHKSYSVVYMCIVKYISVYHYFMQQYMLSNFLVKYTDENKQMYDAI